LPNGQIVKYRSGLMPTYVFRNTKTDELEEHFMKISELDEFKEQNPHLVNQIGAPSMVTDTKSTLTRAGSEWQDHLKEMKKGSGRGNTIKV
jgi:L-lysine 2,3-aminomutase